MAMVVPDKPAQKSFFRQYWYVFFFIWAFVLAFLGFLLRILLGDQLVPIQTNTWNGITPGYSTKSNLEQKVGPALGSTPAPQGTEYFYQPLYETKQQNSAVVDNSNKVLFFKENVPTDKNHTLETYVQSFGDPDLTISSNDVGDGTLGYVFLKAGVVVFAHNQGTVEQKWYFIPTTKEKFESDWDNFILPAQSGPE